MPFPSRHSLLPAALLLLALCCAFGWYQNTHATLGGEISTAKILWLFLALTFFFLVPLWLSRDSALSPQGRRVYQWFMAGYVVRALIEGPMLLFSRTWRVEYGISHNVIMLLLLIVMIRRVPAGGEDAAARRFAPLLCLALAAESLNAWMFGQAARPETGIYFAGNDAVFQRINNITWLEICLLTPWLGLWLWTYRASAPTTRRD